MLSERMFFLIESIGDHFGTSEYNNDTRGSINKVERRLRLMHNYVSGIEEREEQLDNWFFLESIAGDAEDMLVSLSNGENPTDPAISDMITDLIQSIDRIASLNSVTVNTGYNINSGGQLITGSVTVNVGSSSQTGRTQVARRQSYSHEQNCDIVGFKGEIETLLSCIQDDRAQVVGIVGMAGSGKTTLAKHLFHHADIQRSFCYKVWVCISQSWNKMDILYEIFRQTKVVTQEEMKKWSEQELMENLSLVLSAQSYLIILDDLWGVDAWHQISPGIPLSKRSKVVVTTRNGDVPTKLSPAFFILETKPLDLDQSYDLFQRRAFANKDEDVQEPLLSELVKLGKEMVEKCRGLPLAITGLAGALRANKSMDHWKKMSKTLTQKISEAEDSATQGVVREVLALSYDDLPYNLKQCFLYLAMFPEDEEIHTRMLKRMWIAECLVSCDQLPEEEAMWRAEEYLDELCNRYLIINVKRNYNEQVKTFQLHDLVREMCIKKAKEKRILEESHRIAVTDDCEKGQKCLQAQDTINSEHVEQLYKQLQLKESQNSSRLRSLIVMSNTFHSDWMSIIVPTFKFKLLRVLLLKLGDRPVFSLLGEIFELIHLRYLYLEGFVEIILPTFIGNLKNLLTLDIRNSRIKGVQNLCMLRGLRHLCLRRIKLIMNHEQYGLEQLQNLRTLSFVKVGDWLLSEMSLLSHTLHKLGIKEIQRQEELNAVFRDQSIRMLGNLQILKLDWNHDEVKLEPKHMKALKQCENLWKLCLWGRIQEPVVFPQNLIKLEIVRAYLTQTNVMEVLGFSLPCLKVLSLGVYAYLGTELTCKVYSFPKLERLNLIALIHLKHWRVERGAMPFLKELCFEGCPSLYQPPEACRFASKLKQVTVRWMPTQFVKSLQLWREHHRDLTIVHPYSAFMSITTNYW